MVATLVLSSLPLERCMYNRKASKKIPESFCLICPLDRGRGNDF